MLQAERNNVSIFPASQCLPWQPIEQGVLACNLLGAIHIKIVATLLLIRLGFQE